MIANVIILLMSISLTPLCSLNAALPQPELAPWKKRSVNLWSMHNFMGICFNKANTSQEESRISGFELFEKATTFDIHACRALCRWLVEDVARITQEVVRRDGQQTDEMQKRIATLQTISTRDVGDTIDLMDCAKLKNFFDQYIDDYNAFITHLKRMHERWKPLNITFLSVLNRFELVFDIEHSISHNKAVSSCNNTYISLKAQIGNLEMLHAYCDTVLPNLEELGLLAPGLALYCAKLQLLKDSKLMLKLTDDAAYTLYQEGLEHVEKFVRKLEIVAELKSSVKAAMETNTPSMEALTGIVEKLKNLTLK